jgi:hypothetical protein
MGQDPTPALQQQMPRKPFGCRHERPEAAKNKKETKRSSVVSFRPFAAMPNWD